MMLSAIVASAHAACAPVPVLAVGADAHAVSMAEVGEASALGWIDEEGGHLVLVDAEGKPKMVKALGPAAEVRVLGDASTWVAVTRTSQWAGHGACRIEATRVNEKGKRLERRTLITDACPLETPSLAAALRDGTLLVAATTTDAAGASSRDLRIARWAPAPAIPQPLDAVYVEPGLRVDGLVPTAEGYELYWSTRDGHRRSTLDAYGTPRGPTQRSPAPFVPPAAEPGDRAEGRSGRAAWIAEGVLRFQACAP
jgi:hypothetical protein